MLKRIEAATTPKMTDNAAHCVLRIACGGAKLSQVRNFRPWRAYSPYSSARRFAWTRRAAFGYACLRPNWIVVIYETCCRRSSPGMQRGALKREAIMAGESPHDQATTISSSELILASGSPRRAELMRAYGFDIRTIQPPIDEPETVNHGTPPGAQAEALSYFKARSVAAILHEGIVLGGDTIACVRDVCLGKPRNRDDARQILQLLTGTTHDVVTGVTLLDLSSGRRQIQHEVTTITMRPMSDAQLEAYLDSQAWRGKAGAYGIQDHGDQFVERINGSFTNVVGLPMELLSRMLAEWGIFPSENAGPGTVDPIQVPPNPTVH